MRWPPRRTCWVSRLSFKVGDPQYVGALNRRSAQQRLDAHQQFGKVERLGQVIVGAGLEVL